MNEHKQTDICMQCGHTRSMHNADGCQCYIRTSVIEQLTDGTIMRKCTCILDDKQGGIVNLGGDSYDGKTRSNM